MRTWLRGKALLFMALAVLLAVPAVAWAAGDQFQDTLTGTATTQTITAGGSFTNTYYVDAGGQDGCDATTATPAVFSINTPAGVSKNPTTDLSFTGCGIGNAKTVTFSSSTPSGSSGYSITASRVSGSVSSTGQAGFTLIVNPPPDSTPPTLNLPADITQEATRASGNVVTYTATADDANPAHPTVTCSPVSGSTFAIGTTTVNCEATDDVGNKATGSFNVTVAYAWSNFLQPINVTGTQSIFKMGSTVPVKFQLTGASSAITDGTFYLKYAYTGTGDNNGEMEAVATTTGTTGTMFRYSEGQYIYNWSTKGVVTKPGNYELRVYTDSNGTNLLGKVSIELKK